MYSKLPIFSLLALIIFGLSSCKAPIDSKESYLTNYETFVTEIKKNSNDFTEKEWKEKDEEFKTYSNDLYQKYESELGIFEKVRVGKFAITYGSIRGVKALNTVLEDDEIEKSIEELKSLWDDDLQEELETVIKEVSKVWDEDMKHELEGKLGELKMVLEDEKFQSKIGETVNELKDIVNDKELNDDLEEVIKEVEKIVKKIEDKVSE